MHQKQDSFAKKKKVQGMYVSAAFTELCYKSFFRKKTVNQHHYTETLWYVQGWAPEKHSGKQWYTEGGVWGVQTPPPEILKISVESSIA